MRCPKCSNKRFDISNDMFEDGYALETRECNHCEWWETMFDYPGQSPYIVDDASDEGDWELPDWVVVHQPDQDTLPGMETQA